MYKQVAKMTPVARLYEKQLLDTGVLSPDKLASMKKFINDNLEECYQSMRSDGGVECVLAAKTLKAVNACKTKMAQTKD